MFSEKRIFQPSDPDGPTTPALRQRLAQTGRYDPSPRAPVQAGSEGKSPKLPQALRAFTHPEKALIRKIHGYVPPAQLLGILNDRLRGDLGPQATPYTAEQLRAEISMLSAPAANPGTSWAALRKLLAAAERDGTLQSIDERRVQDFAIVFSLSAKQVMRLKDILLQQTQED